MTVKNTGAAAPPEPQGYELVRNRDVGIEWDPDEPYDVLGSGTRIYACQECGATWNADDLHRTECSRREVSA